MSQSVHTHITCLRPHQYNAHGEQNVFLVKVNSISVGRSDGKCLPPLLRYLCDLRLRVARVPLPHPRSSKTESSSQEMGRATASAAEQSKGKAGPGRRAGLSSRAGRLRRAGGELSCLKGKVKNELQRWGRLVNYLDKKLLNSPPPLLNLFSWHSDRRYQESSSPFLIFRIVTALNLRHTEREREREESSRRSAMQL